ncbi:MAG: flagellar biosynthetic protein FliR [Paracoccaceae bacterium]|nr:flagellar biosynthetic protein FliR [Paracoccaceae bacterium]
MDLALFLTSQVLAVGLVFARIGSALAFMPGFGERVIPLRFRLLVALVLSAALAPATPVDAVTIDSPLLLVPLLAMEVALGIWIGVTSRIVMSALQFVGYQIGLIAGLANAFAPETGAFQGSTMIADALMMAGVALIFASDLHHLVIAALLMSYDIFPLGQIMPGDLAEQIVKAVGASFYIGFALTVPFHVMGLVLNLGMGLANRMMPALPVFFVATPVLVAAGLFVLIVAAPSILEGFLDRFAAWLGTMRF